MDFVIRREVACLLNVSSSVSFSLKDMALLLVLFSPSMGFSFFGSGPACLGAGVLHLKRVLVSIQFPLTHHFRVEFR